jgi:hypothetical protein
MKRISLLSLLVVLVVLAIAIIPASAQLGDSDISSFTVQNVSDGDAIVTVTFVAENGTTYTPDPLITGVSNPFTLSSGASQQIFVPNIDETDLPSGRYAVVISADAQIVAQAGVAGTGSLRFSGSYIGFSGGDTVTNIPSVAYNFSGWYSMISVQNVGSDVTDVTVTLTCADGTVGTLTEADVPAMASVTWALKETTPTGFTSSTVCDGSAVVTSTAQPVVAVNNQNKPLTGATNTFEASPTGGSPLFVPNLQNDFSGWNSALTIQKLGAGTTNVTVEYDDGDPDDTCTLTDAAPSCKLYMPAFHNQTGRFGAVITSDSLPILAVIGSTRAAQGWSGAVSASISGSDEVSIPNVSKAFYGWRSAINCQNVGSVPTTLNVSYSGYEAQAYNTASLDEGESLQIAVFNESFITAPWQGGATITANASGAEFVCTVGNSNATGSIPGDWTSQYNAYNK